MENIRLGRQDATDEEVKAAAKDAFADDFIQALDRGYDEIVGERGQGSLAGSASVSPSPELLRTATILDKPPQPWILSKEKI